VLQFPFFRDTELIEQAKRNAAWLIETGNEVELEARKLFPNGVLIEKRDRLVSALINPPQKGQF
jgi:hypothetical protein